MIEESRSPVAATVGGTIVAIIMAFVVISVVSTIVAFIFGMMQYYLSGMRWEAAVVIGNIAGGVASVYAARAACDTVLKHYSLHAVSVSMISLLGILIIFQLTRGLTQETLFRLCLCVPMLIATWLVFWKDDY